jgi:hypothetical protein
MKKRIKYKFEYKTVTCTKLTEPLYTTLNRHGEDGWEYKKTIVETTYTAFRENAPLILLVRRYEMIDDGDVDVDE